MAEARQNKTNMLVHFIGSRSKILNEINYYRPVLESIKKAGHTIAYDWVEDVYALAQKGKLKKENESWAEVDNDNEAALTKADVVIVEGTSKSFFAGYQVAKAAQLKKPILILTRDNSPVAISGLSTPSGFIKSVAYNQKELDSIIADFLQENTIDTKELRFNFFLDRQSYNYLRWVSSKTGKTKAQIIRSLLQKEMNKDD